MECKLNPVHFYWTVLYVVVDVFFCFYFGYFLHQFSCICKTNWLNFDAIVFLFLFMLLYIFWLLFIRWFNYISQTKQVIAQKVMYVCGFACTYTYHVKRNHCDKWVFIWKFLSHLLLVLICKLICRLIN